MIKGNILVTGGAGYIGSVLISRLLNQTDLRIRVLDSLKYGGNSLLPVWGSSRLQLIPGDIRHPETVRRAVDSADYIVHLAALVGEPLCQRYPEDAKTTNLDATLLLADASTAANVKLFVFASTCSNYGMRESEEPVDERAALEPVSLYAETKVQAEDYLRKNKNLKSVILRFATVYGSSPRMRFDLLLHQLIREAYLQKKITVYGPDSWRPLVHAQDACTAIISAIQESQDLSSVYNVGGDLQNYRKRELANVVAKFFPESSTQLLSTVNDRRSYRVSFRRIREELGFDPALSLEDGVEEIAEGLATGVLEGALLKEGNF